MKHLSSRSFFSMAFVVIATCFLPLYLSAQWSTDATVNNVVCSTVNQQLLDAHIASDGSGGALIAWSDRNVVTNDYFVFVQRISSDGKKLWAEDGVAVSTSPNEQHHSEIAGDGKGGAIVTWYESRNGKNEARAQKISADGIVQWDAEGVPVGTAETHFQHSTPVIVSDGSEGAIIAWADWRGDLYNGIYAEYAQRISANGTALWGIEGIPLNTPSKNSVEAQQIISDGNGGAIITWHSYIGSYPNGNQDIFAQKVNAAGNMEWGTDGLAVCSLTSPQLHPKLTEDGNHGAVIVWEDYRTSLSKSNLYAQKVNSAGTIQWAADGVPVVPPVSLSMVNHEVAPDGSGGVFITWQYSNSNVVTAQRLTSAGVNAWQGSGLDLGASSTSYPQIISDGSTGAIITWYDSRGSGSGDIYAQRITGNGSLLWNSKAVGVCTNSATQNSAQLTTDGHGGAIIAWADDRNNATKSTDIYAQQISASGTLGVITGLNEISRQSMLDQNYPNPVKSGTKIRFKVSEPGYVSLKLFNMTGKEVTILVKTVMSPGSYSVDLDATGLPAGIYAYCLQAGGKTHTRSLVVVK